MIYNMINYRQREKQYKRQIEDLEKKLKNLQKNEPYNKPIIPIVDLSKVTFNPPELIERVEHIH